MKDRRRRARCIGWHPSYRCFKPCGVRARHLDTITLQADEFEALRLMDYEGLYQNECARRMGISRTTLSRSVAQARRKVIEALLNGSTLLIGEAAEDMILAPDTPPLASKAPDTPTFPPAGETATRTTPSLHPPEKKGNERK